MDLLKYADKSGIPIDVIESALTLSIETVFRTVYKIPSAYYFTETNTIDVMYRVPKDIDIEQAAILNEYVLEGFDIYKELKMSEFPPEFFSMTKKFFLDYLSRFHEQSKREIWSKRIHTIMPGEILRKENDHFVVQVGTEESIFPFNNGLKKEFNSYKKGNILKFYISRVRSNPFRIYVSRTSPNLPPLLLKSKLPLSFFKCKKRYPGDICYIHSNVPINDKFKIIQKEISEELCNESIKIIPL